MPAHRADKPRSGVCGHCTGPSRPRVIGLFIWARIDDQRQRSFVTGYPGRPPGSQDLEDIRGSMHAGCRQRVADSGQTSVPWRLSRSVIDSVGLAGAEFARNADYRASPSITADSVCAQMVQFWAAWFYKTFGHALYSCGSSLLIPHKHRLSGATVL